uniref:Uncharacterized protein n=1 Tax=viral metagenome TaxID=1070528 RepID=A0A6C0F822_9ZZZZ
MLLILFCDIICRRKTGKPLPDLAMQIISHHLKRLKKNTTKLEEPLECDCNERLVIKGACKKKWTKHIFTKYRIKNAFRYR